MEFLVPYLIISCFLAAHSWTGVGAAGLGINYGRVGDNLPSPYQSIQLIKTMKAGRVKLYDSDPEILQLLSGTNLEVTVMVPNEQIIDIALNQTLSDEWVTNNVLQYYPATMIRTILVGNQVLSSYSDSDREIWRHLVPGMRAVKASLQAKDIRNIKVSTPLAMDVLQSTFPPSNGTFRSDILDSVMSPLLHFLNSTRSPFFLDVYPYEVWSANPRNMSLDMALLNGNVNYTDPGNNMTYYNLLDQMLDSVVFAMERLGYDDIQLVISETGWPNAGDLDQAGANLHNAATYNRNLIQKMTADPPVGTPARPGLAIPTYIFSLYNENRKGGRGTERHWGLVRAEGTFIYDIDLSGDRRVSQYNPLPAGHNNLPYRGQLWCVATSGANQTEMVSALNFACSQGNDTCLALAPGRECYHPLSLFWHATYAFSSYWAQLRSQGAACYFNGLAFETTQDPHITVGGGCQFPSVTL